MSTVACFAELAFRIRVNKSAIGSVICIFLPPSKNLDSGAAYARLPSERIVYRGPSHARAACALPARLFHARNLALVSQLAEANTANAILSQISVRSAADFAPVIRLRAVFRSFLLFQNHCFSCHFAYLLNSPTQTVRPSASKARGPLRPSLRW